MKKEQNRLQQKIIATLNQQADNHRRRAELQAKVFARLEQPQRHSVLNRWGVAGLALAAALTGLSVIPDGAFNRQEEQPQMTTGTPSKLTPQLADDLEMLLVLGEDSSRGG